MTNKSRNNKRTLAKKITSFVLYVDQVTQIQAIIESTEGEKAAQVFRDLIDEALAARRRKPRSNSSYQKMCRTFDWGSLERHYKEGNATISGHRQSRV